MTHLKTLLIAAPAALGLLAAPAANAQWRGHEGWHGGGWHDGHHGYNGALTGALLGLGAAAVVGGIIASQPPAYYPPTAYYAPPPTYYAPPPAYYGYPQSYYTQPEYAPN
jgi:hypothetical protein